MTQVIIKLRNEELQKRIRDYAENRKISMSAAIERLLQDAVERVGTVDRKPIGHALDRYIGQWSDAEEQSFLESVEVFNAIDPEIWK